MILKLAAFVSDPFTQGTDGPGQEAAQGQAAGRERGEGARALRDGHRRLEERDPISMLFFLI